MSDSLWWFRVDTANGDVLHCLCDYRLAEQQTGIFIHVPKRRPRGYRHTLYGAGMSPDGKYAGVLGEHRTLAEARAAGKALYVSSPETYRR